MRILQDIRPEQKGRYNKEAQISLLYTFLLGKNRDNTINGYNTYTGVVVYEQRNDLHWEFKKDILVGMQRREMNVGKEEIRPKDLRAQVNIKGTTMYSIIMNDPKNDTSIKPDQVNNYNFHTPTLQKSGKILQTEQETQYGQAMVLKLNYSGYRKYINGKVKAVVASQIFGVKTLDLIDVIHDKTHKYLQSRADSVLEIWQHGILTPGNINNYFEIEKTRGVINTKIKRLQILGKDSSELSKFAVALDNYVATTEYDILLYQRSFTQGKKLGDGLKIAVVPQTEDWQIQELVSRLSYNAQITEVWRKFNGKLNTQYGKYYNTVIEPKVQDITIIGLKELQPKNMREGSNVAIQQRAMLVGRRLNSLRRAQTELDRLMFRDGFTLHIPGIQKIQKTALSGVGVVEIQDYNDLEVIQSRAFEQSDLNKIVIGKNVRKIGSYAYGSCKIVMEYLEIPQNVRFIGGSAFMGNSIKVLKINNPNIQITQTAFVGASIKKLMLPMALKNKIPTLKLRTDTKVQFY